MVSHENSDDNDINVDAQPRPNFAKGMNPPSDGMGQREGAFKNGCNAFPFIFIPLSFIVQTIPVGRRLKCPINRAITVPSISLPRLHITRQRQPNPFLAGALLSITVAQLHRHVYSAEVVARGWA